jgi:hypothetical protein
MTLSVEWQDFGREPQEKPNPNYPEGIDIDATMGAERACSVALPYPAKRCGVFIVVCDVCGLSMAITTAGRPDDPRSVKMACRPVS